MALEFSNNFSVFALAIALAAFVAILFLFHRRKQARQSSLAIPTGKSDHAVEVEFEFLEIPAIRKLLGPSVAGELIEHLARNVLKQVPVSSPPHITDVGLVFTFESNPAGCWETQLASATSILTTATNFAGATFNCSVTATIRDTQPSADSWGKSGAKGSESGSDRSDEGCAARFAMLKQLQNGMENGAVALAYQPKLDLRTNSISSAEALLRWNHPDGEAVDIGELIALCEQIGMIKDLTRWTIAKAIADIAQFNASGLPLLVFVNISGALLADTEFADDLLNMVGQSGANIGIEITETAVIADPVIAIENLNRFAQAGIAIAIDDFGAGLSSLEYLQRLPASELKIDRTFIGKLSSSNRSPLIIRATIDLAHALEMRVTAEGVDDHLSLALLKIMGCDLAQGYLISHPLEPAKFIEFLTQSRSGAACEKPRFTNMIAST